MVRSCIQSILKMFNSIMGMVGIAMILYALWLIKVWERQMGDFPFGGDSSDYPAPWYASFTYLSIFIFGK